jgi:N-acetylglucosamine-6-phosphate deacetylase
MLILADAEVVLPDRVLNPGWLSIEDDRIVQIESGRYPHPEASVVSLEGRRIVPGFVDVHVHGLLGHDVLDGPESLSAVALDMPRYGVTAFSPTSVACEPAELRRLLDGVSATRARPPAGARVLPAHLESNFINPEYRGAQPPACLRLPPESLSGSRVERTGLDGRQAGSKPDATFGADDILEEIERASGAVGIVTLAPELPGALALIAWLNTRGIRVSLGHSGASFEEGLAAIDAGAERATHLFNRMPPFHHRAPGLVGALMGDDRVAVEVIGDGFHLHPAIVRTVVETKHPSRTMAVTDGTAASGLPVGTRTRLGSQTIRVGTHSAELEDGTLAGSSTTMDLVFGLLVHRVGLSPCDAARLCATTPASQMGLDETGSIAPGKLADLVVLDAQGGVDRTYVGGALAFSAGTSSSGDPSI